MQPADELVELHFEPGVEPAFDMALEQPCQTSGGESKRQEYGDSGGDKQSDAERPEAHAGSPRRT